jgi:hypothetical protein
VELTMWLLAQLLLVSSLISLDLTRAASFSTLTTSSAPSTSPFRTVNYITHSLAQQCLTSSRKANATSTAVDTSPSSEADVSSSISVTTENTGGTVATARSAERPEQNVKAAESTTQEEVPHSASNTEVRANPADEPEDSPLDDGKFMSFEDWKRDNLRKVGQSEHIGKGTNIESQEPRKRPSGLRDSLDSLGDDAEIDLDFSGFVSDNLEAPAQNTPRFNEGSHASSGDIDPTRPPKAGARGKDAGTTCKERFNYASFDCAANVLKWNPEAKSPSAVLGENKDSYMLNECSAQNKFLILELCNDISIDTIVLANFEFFSSTFQTFRVSVSDRYPVKIDKWKTLGTFEARNSREVQAFLVDNPVIWARYLRIEFLTHYGNEFYCPVSLVRVHGTTMLEDYKRDLEALQMEDDDKAQEETLETSPEDRLVPEAVAEQLLTQASEGEPVIETIDVEISIEPGMSLPETTSAIVEEMTPVQASGVPTPTCPAQTAFAVTDVPMVSHALDTCPASEYQASISEILQDRKTVRASPKDEPVATTGNTVADPAPSENVTLSIPPMANNTTPASNTPSTSPKSDPVTDSRTSNASSSTTVINSSKTAATSTQSSQPAPTMQESFFKSVQKRLQMLEANSSLSLQYIEDQSRALRDAFQKVEQRQLAKTTSFLDYLNATVLNELREFRQQYDQLWQSTVIELEMQRERYERENLVINTRLGVLADEIIFQKRVSFLQLILIVVCLGLVMFSKGNLNSYLELPLVQSVLSRSPSTRFLNATSPDTPVQSSPASRSNSTGAMRKRLGILKGHRRFPSEDSTENNTSPIEPYTPPTPVSFGDPPSEIDDLDDNNTLGDPQFDPSLIERPSTSPPVLSGTESPAASDLDGDIREDSIDSVIVGTPTNIFRSTTPILIIEDATPPPKHLKWQLPED